MIKEVLASNGVTTTHDTNGPGSAVTRFVYDGDALIGELDGSNTWLRRYVHGAGVDDPLVWYEGPGIGGTNRKHFAKDRQGSVIGVASSGTAIAKNRYDPYGVPDPLNQGRFAYTGQTVLPELGLYYYKARIYSPHLGRFLQTDPIGYEDQMNLYAYVHNDPMNMADPTGEFANILIGGIAGAVVGAAIEKVTNPDATVASIRRAAIVGGAAGALGPAGGTAARAALVGRAAASASNVSKAIPSDKALVAVTDTAADIVGQPTLGAVDAALQGNDAGLGAVEGVAAAGAGAGVDAAAAGGSSSGVRAAGVRGTLVSTAKAGAKQGLKALTSSGAAGAVERIEPPQIDDQMGR